MTSPPGSPTATALLARARRGAGGALPAVLPVALLALLVVAAPGASPPGPAEQAGPAARAAAPEGPAAHPVGTRAGWSGGGRAATVPGPAGVAAGPVAPGVAAYEAGLEELAATAGIAARPAYRLPVAGGGLRARFDPPAHRWSAGHRGVDLDAPSGVVVVAPAAGTVTFAGPVVDRHVVTVLHDDGLRSSVEPVLATVQPGARVSAGQAIGTVEPPPAATHCAVRCLHWGVRDGPAYVDPLDLLPGAGPVVLLPVP